MRLLCIALCLYVPASAAPLLGSKNDITSSSTCKTLKCTFLGKASLPGGVTFLNYRIELRNLNPYGGYASNKLPQGIFTFQVNGINRMIGFYQSGQVSMRSNDGLGLTKALTIQFAKDVAGVQSLPNDQLFKEYDGVMAFNTDSEIEEKISSGTWISNRTAQKFKGSANGYFTVAYIADAKYYAKLRQIINRDAPLDAIAMAEKFISDQKIKVHKTIHCDTVLADDSRSAPMTKWFNYLEGRGNVYAVGDPTSAIFVLPGFSRQGIIIGDVYINTETGLASECLFRARGW